MYLSKIPIKIMDETIDIEVHQHSTIELLVKQILGLNTELRTCKLPDKIEQIKAHIQHDENKINEIVYQVYGLTKEEIGIVEASIKS